MGPIRTLDGHEAQLLPGALEGLRAGWNGHVVLPGEDGYDAARTIWNGMIDRRPALILRCASPSDVQRAVRFVAEHELLFSVRGGGHHIAGNAVCEQGVQIDLSLMRRIRIDAATQRASVGPGCTLHDFDGAAQRYGLATPLGINSTTGVAGLTLGGGFGWLTRRYGMTVDNLLSADVVTAAGEQLHASEQEHPELFWALRGGGGNFGIITQFEYILHQVGPTILAGLIVHPFEDADNVLRFYREFNENAPDDISVWAVARKAPPLPFLPVEWHGRLVLVLAAFHAGSDIGKGEHAMAPLRAFGKPIADVIGLQSYAGWQQTFDPLLTPGARNYWKSHDFTKLSDALFDSLEHYLTRLPSDECEIFFGQVGGVASRIPQNRTAYANRRTSYVMNVHTRWQHPAQDAECIAWARDFFQASAPFAAGSAYVNFLTEDEAERVKAAYGANWERLVQVKNRYDPHNLFRMNQNIAPDLAVAAAPEREARSRQSRRSE